MFTIVVLARAAKPVYFAPMRVPISPRESLIEPGREPELARGVKGYAVEHGGWIWIPLIIAEAEGAGDVGRFLDAVEPDRTVVVPNVLHPKLWGMLERRGWARACDPETGTEIFVRGPLKCEEEPFRLTVATVAEHILAFVQGPVLVRDIVSRLDFFDQPTVLMGLGYAMGLGRLDMVGGYDRQCDLLAKTVKPV